MRNVHGPLGQAHWGEVPWRWHKHRWLFRPEWLVELLRCR
jgi:hypothetical protein